MGKGYMETLKLGIIPNMCVGMQLADVWYCGSDVFRCYPAGLVCPYADEKSGFLLIFPAFSTTLENVEAFGRKRQSVLFEMQVHFTSNALAFHIECTCVFLKRTCVLLVQK